jgi:membrane associated rhomboid family serine protease
MFPLTDVVKHLIIINVLMFIGTMLTLGETDYSIINNLINYPDPSRFLEWNRNILSMFYPGSVYFRPYQLVTHMFMHADLMHLLFNMFGVYFFGPPLEHRLGSKRFFGFYLLCGFGALALHMIVRYFEVSAGMSHPDSINVPLLGASGAVFGLLAGFAMFYPNQIIRLLFPPIALKAKYFVLIYAGVELFFGIGGFQQGVAHFAHLGGAIVGALLIYFWKKNEWRK